MSNEFVRRCAELAEINPADNDTDQWAHRAFACVAIAGEMIDNEQVKEGLAEMMSRAPIPVLAGGTMFIMQVKGERNE